MGLPGHPSCRMAFIFYMDNWSGIMKKENEFTLDKHSYYCAYHFAMQYKEFKEELEDLSAAYTKQSYDSTPIRSGRISNKTESLAIQRHTTK